MNDIVKALIQGLVEGLTEFIPVSSTGHLILFGAAIDFHGVKADTFDVFIQSGAMLAVLVLYHQRFVDLLRPSGSAGLAGQGFLGWGGISKLIVASLPALLLGFVLHSSIKQYLFNPVTVALGLIVGGVALIFIDRDKKHDTVKNLESVSLKECLGIGLFQCLSLWPGISRSGSTILGGRILGLSRKTAAELSFILAVPIICAAAGYDLLKNFKFLEASDLPLFAVGFFTAFITALLAIRFFVTLLGRVSLAPFGWYRIAVGVFVLWLYR